MSIAYYKTAIVGGASNSLDGEDGNSLQDNDFAICLVSNETSFYILDATSGLAESFPDVISPDTNPGTKRWILQSISGIIVDADDIDDTSTTNKFVTSTDLTKLANTSGINTGDQDLSTLALKTNVLELDNTTTYTPTADYHPTTKKYMDEQVIAGGGYTDEQALDAVGGALTDSATIDLTFDDGADTITGDVIPSGIALDTLGATTDITTLNSSTSKHGLMPKLNGSTTQFLNGLGLWVTPAGGGGSSSPLIYAADYGALGDYSNNDAPAIQAALDYAATLFTGGTVILNGKHVLNTGLSWTASNITLRGIGGGQAQLFGNFAAGDIVAIGDGVADINHGVIEQVFIGALVQKTSGAAIAFKGGHHCNGTYVRIDSVNLWDGITIDGREDTSSYLTFINQFEMGNIQGDGIVIGGDPTLVRPIGVYISNGVIANVDGSGMKIVTTDGSYFNTIDILGCTNSVLFEPVTELPLIDQIGPDQNNSTNMFFYSVLADTSNGDGFNLKPAGGNVSGLNFVSCWGASCANNGFNLDAVNGTVTHISMSNCRAVNNRHYGIYMGNGAYKISLSNTQVYGNSVLNNGVYDGIFIGGNTTDFTITNGMIWSELFPGYNHQRYGIYIAPGCDEFVIAGVNVNDNKVAGIMDESGSTRGFITNCLGVINAGTSVKDFGAVGDGVADDYSAIQLALDTNAGKLVTVPEGTYLLDTTLLIHPGTTLHFLSREAIFKRNASTDAMLLNYSAGTIGGYDASSDITIKGGTFNCNRTTYTGNCTTIGFGHSSNIIVDNVRFTNNPAWHALELNAVKNGKAINCIFDNYGSSGSEYLQLDLAKSASEFPWFGPYDYTPCEDIEVTGCKFMDGIDGVGSHAAVAGYEHKNIRIHGNSFRDMSGTCVKGYSWNDVTVINNSCDNVGYGITFSMLTGQTGSGYVISNNILLNVDYTTTGRAIQLYDYCENGVVSGNHINTSSYYGIGIDKSSNWTVEGNVVLNCARVGIWIYGTSETVISGNTCNGTTVAGYHDIRVGWSTIDADDCIISNNICGVMGIEPGSAHDNLITNNRIGTLAGKTSANTFINNYVGGAWVI